MSPTIVGNSPLLGSVAGAADAVALIVSSSTISNRIDAAVYRSDTPSAAPINRVWTLCTGTLSPRIALARGALHAFGGVATIQSSRSTCRDGFALTGASTKGLHASTNPL